LHDPVSDYEIRAVAVVLDHVIHVDVPSVF
jgi:hypothetical protein